MAQSKARSGRRPASTPGGRPAAAAARSARTASAVSATPTSRPVTRPTAKAADPEEFADEVTEPERERGTGQPLWLQVVSFVLAIAGLGVSAYETWAHYNGSHLAGCSAKGGTFDCTAVITSSQSMVFGVIPVAVLGLAFYVAAVPLFSPWLWRVGLRWVHQLRLASVIAGMGFVMYLIFVEFYQIGQVCDYCSVVHAVTFLLFCITVFSAAIWGLGAKPEPSPRA
jgi:uncharacterized membrane protein